MPTKPKESLKLSPNPGVDGSAARPVQKFVSVPVYTSIVGVHTTLLAFVGLFIPKTKVLQDLAHYDAAMTPLSSKDRPQHPFFEDLTRSPTVTLFSLCVGTLVLQTLWSAWLKDCWINITIHGEGEDLLKHKYPPVGQKAKDLARVYGAVFLASAVLHLILVLFGAPITELVFKTYLLALLISTLAILPALYIFGLPTWSTNDSGSLVKRWTWVRLFAEFSPRNTVERALVYPWVGVVVGSWLGIIPTALDWDRPWQAWPLTPAYGALGGYIASSILAVTVDAVFSQNHISV